MTRLAQITFAALFTALAATGARAHVTLEQPEARAGSFYKAVLKVPHGCDGTATTAIRVRLPAGLIAVKPMPKPGWRLETKTGPYDKTYSYFHGLSLKDGVAEISWSGGRLPDAWYDEFVFQGFVASDVTAGEPLYFRVVQECEKGVHRWIEIPESGKTPADLKEPAPRLQIAPMAPPRH